jgi:hypothetical protein
MERDIQNTKYIISINLSFVQDMFEAWVAVSNDREKECALSQFSQLVKSATKETGSPRTVCLGVALAILDNINKENLQISEDEIQ